MDISSFVPLSGASRGPAGPEAVPSSPPQTPEVSANPPELTWAETLKAAQDYLTSEAIPDLYKVPSLATILALQRLAGQLTPEAVTTLSDGPGSEPVVVSPQQTQKILTAYNKHPWLLDESQQKVSAEIAGKMTSPTLQRMRRFGLYIGLEADEIKAVKSDFTRFRLAKGLSWLRPSRAEKAFSEYKDYHRQRLALHTECRKLPPFEWVPLAPPSPEKAPASPTPPWQVGTAEAALHSDGSQDRHIRDVNKGIFGIFDGMGGAAGGAEAASVVSETIHRQLTGAAPFSSLMAAQESLAGAFATARTTWAQQASKKGFNRGGTTAAVMVVASHDGAEYAVWRNAGDSVIIVYRDGELIRCTTEQIVPETPHVLTNCIDVHPDRRKDETDSLRLQPGDKLLLASDGITGDQPDERLTDADFTAAFSKPTPQACADEFQRRSRKTDDKTAVVLFYNGPGERKAKALQRKLKSALGGLALGSRLSGQGKRSKTFLAQDARLARQQAGQALGYLRGPERRNLVVASGILAVALAGVVLAGMTQRGSVKESAVRPTPGSAAPTTPKPLPTPSTRPQTRPPTSPPAAPTMLRATREGGPNHTYWGIAKRQARSVLGEAAFSRLTLKQQLQATDALKDAMLSRNNKTEGAAYRIPVGQPIKVLSPAEALSLVDPYVGKHRQ